MTVKMFSKYFLFIAFLFTPIIAMFCTQQLLYFFIIYPFTALFTKKWGYFKAVVFLILPPVFLLIWTYFFSQQNSVIKSLRWILSIISGVYFASELGASGISSVLRSFHFSYAHKLADVIDLGGKVIIGVKPCWSQHKGVTLTERVVLTVENSINNVSLLDIRKEKKVHSAAIAVAFLSWLLVLLTISGVELF